MQELVYLLKVGATQDVQSEISRRFRLALSPQFVRLSSTNVARWLGLFPRKGTLRPGSDADLAIYARGVSDIIRAEGLLCKQKWTPYDGRQVSFRVEACMVRGVWVYKDGAIQGGPRGQFIPSGPTARHDGSAALGVPA